MEPSNLQDIGFAAALLLSRVARVLRTLPITRQPIEPAYLAGSMYVLV
jgi:hypothetical protein